MRGTGVQGYMRGSEVHEGYRGTWGVQGYMRGTEVHERYRGT